MTWRARCDGACGIDGAHAERLLERPAEMVRAQASELGEGGERDLVGEMLLDITCDSALLPAGEPTPDRRLDVGRTGTETHKFVGEHDAERFTVKPIDRPGPFDQGL
jgi:hypothetical protein